MTHAGAGPEGGGPDEPVRAGSGRRLLVLLPLLIVAVLAVLFFIRLFAGDPSKVPSALIGRPVPQFSLPPVAGLVHDGKPVPGLSSDDLRGRVSVVNVWASWCGPCRQEHPFLLDLAKDPRIRLVGIDYKDTPENGRRFLGTLGNPFAAVGSDTTGRVGIDWGVYGVPETFVVDANGQIRYKHVGPLTAEALATTLEAAIRAAQVSAEAAPAR